MCNDDSFQGSEQDQATPPGMNAGHHGHGPSPEHASGDEVLGLLDKLGAQLEQLRTFKSERDAFQNLQAQRDAEFAERQRQVESMASEVERRRLEAEQAEHALTGARAQVEAESQRIAGLSREIEARSAELESKFREADQRLQQAEQRAHSLEQHQRQLAERQSELEQAAAIVSQKARELEQREAQASSMAAQEHGEVAGLRQQLEQAGHAMEQLRQQVAAAEQRTVAAQNELAQASQRLAEAERKAEQALKASVGSGDASKAYEEKIAKYDKVVEALKGKLASSESTIATLTVRLEEAAISGSLASSASAGEELASVELRRERLRVYKALLQQQARKIAQAKKVLEKRQTELEKNVGSRTRAEETKLNELKPQVQAEKEEVARIRKSAMARAARNRAGLFVLFFGLGLCLIAAASWFAAGKVAKPTYLATATIGLDERDIVPGSDQVDAWQQFQRQLVSDPQLLEQASQRMDARGFRELRTPSDLRAFLGESLEINATQPGRIGLAMRGEGEGRTARMLETLVTSLVAYSNDTRDLRRDQASTVVVTAARAEGEPVEDPRVAVAGMIAGGASALALFLAVVFWRSMTRPPDDEDAMLAVTVDAGVMPLDPSDSTRSPSATRRPI